MKQAREYPQVKVSKKAEHAIIKGHPWVYFNEITEAHPFENGELVDVVSQKGSYLGTGFANENSKIRVRLISRNANDKFDEAFLRDVFVMRLITVKLLWETIFPTVA